MTLSDLPDTFSACDNAVYSLDKDAAVSSRQKWSSALTLAAKDILKSPNTYSANINRCAIRIDKILAYALAFWD